MTSVKKTGILTLWLRKSCLYYFKVVSPAPKDHKNIEWKIIVPFEANMNHEIQRQTDYSIVLIYIGQMSVIVTKYIEATPHLWKSWIAYVRKQNKKKIQRE